MEELNQLVIQKADGSSEVADILFTFEANGKKYVVFEFHESGEVSGAVYLPDVNDDKNGTLLDIETDEEWELLEEALDNYYNELEALEAESGEELED
jgi:uncharacterized protein YrzB (UPF0473 family)